MTLRLPSVRAAGIGAALAAFAAFLVVGLLGARGYVDNFLLYRGFPPPREPAFVKHPGTLVKVGVPSPALGGRRQETYVYLPPGYASHQHERYPVLYLLHGAGDNQATWTTFGRAHLILDNLLVQFFMAVHDRVFLPILGAGVVAEGALIVLFHNGVGQVVTDVLISLLGLLVLLAVRCYLLLPTLHASSLAEPEPAV